MAKLKATPEVAEDAPTFVEAPKTRDANEPLAPKPLQGDVDFAAMRKRIAAKFPKTLAKLAE